MAVYDYVRGREYNLEFIFGDNSVYCISTRKGYTKDGNYQELRLVLDFAELTAKNYDKFEGLIFFISSDEMARVLLHALKEYKGEVNYEFNRERSK